MLQLDHKGGNKRKTSLSTRPSSHPYVWNMAMVFYVKDEKISTTKEDSCDSLIKFGADSKVINVAGNDIIIIIYRTWVRSNFEGWRFGMNVVIHCFTFRWWKSKEIFFQMCCVVFLPALPPPPPPFYWTFDSVWNSEFHLWVWAFKPATESWSRF